MSFAARQQVGDLAGRLSHRAVEALLLPEHQSHAAEHDHCRGDRDQADDAADAGLLAQCDQLGDVLARAVDAQQGLVGLERLVALLHAVVQLGQFEQDRGSALRVAHLLPRPRLANQHLRAQRAGRPRVGDDVERGGDQIAVDQRIEQVDRALLELGRVGGAVRDQDRAQVAQRTGVVRRQLAGGARQFDGGFRIGLALRGLQQHRAG